MKLTLLFIMMDLLTLLALPLIFMHGKLCHFLKLDKDVVAADEQASNFGRL